MAESQRVIVRAMESRDVAECGALVGRSPFFKGFGYSAEAADAELARAVGTPGQDLRVAERDGRLVGFAWYVQRGAFARSGYLRLIVVDEARKGRGTGAALMGALESTYLALTDMFLLVTDSNLDAQGFYRRLGYRQVCELADYVRTGSSELIFRKAREATR